LIIAFNKPSISDDLKLSSKEIIKKIIF